jgi:hypothetical protein
VVFEDVQTETVRLQLDLTDSRRKIRGVFLEFTMDCAAEEPAEEFGAVNDLGSVCDLLIEIRSFGGGLSQTARRLKQ